MSKMSLSIRPKLIFSNSSFELFLPYFFLLFGPLDPVYAYIINCAFPVSSLFGTLWLAFTGVNLLLNALLSFIPSVAYDLSFIDADVSLYVVHSYICPLYLNLI